MEIKKEILSRSRIKLTIKLSSPEMRGYFDGAYKKLAPQVQIEGFRPGAAPRSMIISAIGENRLNSEIIDAALQDSYVKALKKEDIAPIAPPAVQIKMVKDLETDSAELEYEAEVDVLPKIALGDYKKIKINKKSETEFKATGEEAEEVLTRLARQHAEFKDLEGPLKEDDRLEMNFEGSEKGVRLDNLTSKNYPVILGSKVLIPEFEKNLIGLKKGDKKSFSLEMPVLSGAEGSPNLNEKKRKVDFNVEIIQTQKVILPKMDDAFASRFQKSKIEDLKKAIKEDIIKQKKEQREKELEGQVLDELLTLVKVDVPESLMSQELERQINEMRSRIAMFGLSFEQYLANMKKTEAELKESLKPQAEKTIKIGLALGEIVKLEKIDPKDKEAGKLALKKLIAYATK